MSIFSHPIQFRFSSVNTRFTFIFFGFICTFFLSFPSSIEAAPDVLVLKNGAELKGAYQGNDAKYVFFKPRKKRGAIRYPHGKIMGIILGRPDFHFFTYLVPGLIQYKRRQTWKTFILTPLFFLSAVSVGAGVLLAIEQQARLQKPDIDNVTIEDAQNKKTLYTTLALVSAGVFAITYAVHLIDVVYWGDQYKSLLTINDLGMKKQDNDLLYFSYDYQRSSFSIPIEFQHTLKVGSSF